jgi:hypothetical protein
MWGEFMGVIRKIAVCLFVVISLAGGAKAQPRSEPPTPDQVAAFLANPGPTLAANLNGSSAFIALVQAAALTSPDALAMIVSLLGNATPAQQSAIGAGLGQAALASPGNPLLAGTIQTALAASANANAIDAYISITGNAQAFASAGAGGGGAGYAGGPPGGGGGGGGSGGPTFGGSSNLSGGGGSTISQSQVNGSGN